MIDLTLPGFDYKVKQTDGKLYIFDVLRKKFIFLTPEEWVRQHFVHFLINHHRYPKSLMKLEGGLQYNKLTKRTDIVTYDRNGNPFLVVECKGANITLCQSTFDQAAQYNHTLKAPYIAVTNGLVYHCCAINHQEGVFSFMNDLPIFE